MTLLFFEGNRLIPGIYVGWEGWSVWFVESCGKGLLSGQLGRLTFGIQSTDYNYRHHLQWLERHQQLELSFANQKQP